MSELFFLNRKISDKKTEKVFVFVGTGQEKDSVDDGYSWRKYGAKEISGSINPRFNLTLQTFCSFVCLL